MQGQGSVGEIHVGTSGFSYRHWQGVLYPDTLSSRRWLEYYAGAFATVELNVTFYRMPGERAVLGWGERVPAGFIFAVKLSRYITHVKRLHDADESLALFLSRVRLLGNHLGPILIQLPPQHHQDNDLLDAFLTRCDPACRWAVEFRHESWLQETTYQVLARHGVALCIHDILPDHPRKITAPFSYLRFHGVDERYSGNYPDDCLRDWAAQIHAWQPYIDIYAYFNNDAHGYAVANARTLRQYITG